MYSDMSGALKKVGSRIVPSAFPRPAWKPRRSAAKKHAAWLRSMRFRLSGVQNSALFRSSFSRGVFAVVSGDRVSEALSAAAAATAASTSGESVLGDKLASITNEFGRAVRMMEG